MATFYRVSPSQKMCTRQFAVPAMLLHRVEGEGLCRHHLAAGNPGSQLYFAIAGQEVAGRGALPVCIVQTPPRWCADFTVYVKACLVATNARCICIRWQTSSGAWLQVISMCCVVLCCAGAGTGAGAGAGVGAGVGAVLVSPLYLSPTVYVV